MSRVAVDTSVLVRYLVQDDPRQGAAAAQVLDGPDDVWVSLVAIVETAYVLGHHYAVPRSEIVDSLVRLLRKRNVHVMGADADAVAAALTWCAPSSRTSFADALIHADARAHGIQAIHSFDRRFPSSGLTVMDPVKTARSEPQG